MKRFSFCIIILVFILSGCSTSFHIKKAQEKCPECFELDTTITYLVFKLDTVIRIDSTFLILLPRDTVKIDTVIRKLKPYSFKPIYDKNGIINVEVSMIRGALKIRSYLDSAMLYRLQDSIRIKDAIITNLTEVTIKQGIIIKEKKTLIERLKSNIQYGFIVLFVIACLFMSYKIYKFFKK